MKLKNLLFVGALAAGAVWLYKKYKADEELLKVDENEDFSSDPLPDEEDNEDEA